MEPYGIIYTIINKINGKMYIGQTKRDLNLRWNEHTCECKSGNRHLKNALSKYGKQNFVIIKLCYANSQNELDILEKSWIKFFDTADKNNGYNKNIGGNGNNGFAHTSETKLKISKALKGKNIGVKGRHSRTLNDIQILEIRNKLLNGLSYSILAKEYGVTKSIIAAIKYGTSICYNSVKICNNPKPKIQISEVVVKEIRALLELQIKQKDIAQKFNISISTVSDIKLGKRRRGVV